ncbi:conserved hypothetical protein [Trichinella spiralis]|uniref:Uncharacterized protein n=1 Tax=Trichinella spiralis TaxID=6334 RepID=E5SFK1_TRISP|nr:conserved hypothetical protein [Trichinella spiralis]KRY37483.1 hypothetical protein T01_13422 [Trichinella spiralis]
MQSDKNPACTTHIHPSLVPLIIGRSDDVHLWKENSPLVRSWSNGFDRDPSWPDDQPAYHRNYWRRRYHNQRQGRPSVGKTALVIAQWSWTVATRTWTRVSCHSVQ